MISALRPAAPAAHRRSSRSTAHTSSIPCFILDMSTTGARIELRQEAGNPFLSRWTNVDRIWVVVRSDRVMYDCSIVRRDDTELGVRFMAAPKAVTRFSR